MIDKYFRTSFSRDIFNHKYRHEGCETWDKLADTLVEDVCRDKLNKSDKAQLKKIITEMKFIPGGRYLYYAGREYKAFNNCFAGKTKLVTDKGLIFLKDYVNQTVNVLSPVTGEFLPAKIINHGKQQLRKITFQPLRGKSSINYEIEATRNHHWLLKNGTDTYDLRVGDLIPANFFNSGENKLGFIHGLVFGDGSLEYVNKTGGHTFVNKIRLCGQKDKELLPKLEQFLNELDIEYTLSYPESYNNDPLLRMWCDYSFKELPNGDASYTSSFIKGWLAADSSEIVGKKLTSVNEIAIDWFIENAALAGIVIVGKKRFQIRDTEFAKQHKIFTINYSYGKDYAGFKVVKIENSVEEDVYCPFEPIYNQIVIENNIHTFNCYLLKSEEDSREDWANLSWKAESCLMTGGGIGNDYSVYRPKNSIIKKTGGLASGPLSKAKMINEIGREVMQGGSRRAAIYGSLSWKHGDILEWIHAKDWSNIKVLGTDFSVGDLKEKDFNFPAPLDMTNISVNYDTDWLENYKSTGNVGSVFLENTIQALKTSEPGFSFNFYEKENETLRNACTEVSSEDDSDVCNLGSVNLANISTIEEFQTVVELATKFLLCGTLVATLPYDKVYKIREKNRRLGLGLMGLHEWLLKKNYKYEVVPELKEWLLVYKNYSNHVSKKFSEKLGISRPIANRAIAPVGTIGILAGTTTAIEPLYAVAFKRRYLKSKTQWVYQYVIDGTAKLLIEQFGINPDNIESAIDLQSDYERRIKFQADVQDYVDMSISSTINLPKWGSELNNEDTVVDFANTLARYAPRLRGFTCYADGSRGGQPLTSVPYKEAISLEGQEFEEVFHDICKIGGSGGTCGA